MTFDKVLELYGEGKIDKKEYSMQMFKKYEELLKYKTLIRKSHVAKIIIDEEEVIFRIRSNNTDGTEYQVDMVLYEEDAAAVPVTVLNFESGYEPEELEMVSRMCNYIGGEGNFFDIGANLGWYSLNICKQYPQMKCFAFEPIKETYLKMIKNLEINNIQNCEAYNFGFSNVNKEISFYFDIVATGASSMVDLRELETTKKVDCEVKRLDDFWLSKGFDRVDFIKCDVEGAELLVYEGGIEGIKRFKPIIYSEMLRKWSAKFGYHPNDIISILSEIDYECYVISENKLLKAFDKVTEETIETNYFFLHKVKHKEIILDLLDYI